MNMFEDKTIRALSWKEPFGTLMLHGKIETRTWYTKYRGLVLMCGSKKGYTDEEVFQISGDLYGIDHILQHSHNCNWNLFSGKAFAIGNLVECRGMLPSDECKCFVSYDSSLYCHVYEDVQPIEPFDWKGSQGWKVLTDIQKTLIKIIL